MKTRFRLNIYVSDAKGSHKPASLVGAFEARARQLRKGISDAQTQAARAAQTTSIRTLDARRDKRPRVAARAGRDARSIRSAIEWKPTRTGVSLDVTKLNNEAPHWIIQEIGTGNSANVRTGGVALPTGRPRKNATTRRSVPSQVGRPISRRLVWADAAGNFAQYSKGRHQLALASQLSGVPYRRKTIVIKREIQPKHYIQAGAKEGFRVYRRSVLAAARQSLIKKR